jgi:hypothetical protein
MVMKVNVIDAKLIFLKKELQDMSNSDFFDGDGLLYILTDVIEMIEKIQWRKDHGRIN